MRVVTPGDLQCEASSPHPQQLNAQLQECLVLFYNLTFNAIDQEGASYACLDVEEKKRKRTMSGPS
jgi:hypothetical protein